MPRQTKSFLLARFREMGIRPATRHGQNFLIDLNLVELIVEGAELTSDDVVLEVGTGTGSLTAMMAERAAAVVTVEIDSHLFELASEQLIDMPNVTMLRLDALHNKNKIDDRVMDAIGEQLSAVPGRRLKLVANLPYNIATPIISNLLLARHVPHSMTVTIQKELAERITASPSTKDYSALSVWIQSQCTAEIVRLMPPSVFWPAPKVTSAVLRIVVDPQRRARIADLNFFHQIIKALFLHRRKFLRANVVAAMKNHLDKPAVDQLLDECGFAPETRTEELDVDTLIGLAERIRSVAPDWKL
ncbi:MAG TPA: 16S rRNA (adenine(1518)-N(6)/adenine(1519)-N(6))-dimethyltransferase RsmA [Lacipirellulaceae bacterium]|jgi:16S rRNA (adenine1518-N6/adenine1519-N6)-dimethyltransferase|nr:16S rRNA (adenine(1518)-N(6)/adenine(1519)-N(6))-dimethyltransferase RsmA [Lacipirellulaceae bacterium]